MEAQNSIPGAFAGYQFVFRILKTLDVDAKAPGLRQQIPALPGSDIYISVSDMELEMDWVSMYIAAPEVLLICPFKAAWDTFIEEANVRRD